MYTTSWTKLFQSTLPMRGETAVGAVGRDPCLISIHSPHAGRDFLRFSMTDMNSIFQSTLPMRGETLETVLETIMFVFQSTLPMRGETPRIRDSRQCCQNFNPLSPCGERRHTAYQLYQGCYFNPLSPCGERHPISFSSAVPVHFNPLSPCGERPYRFIYPAISATFQSTLPMRGETVAGALRSLHDHISIHSPHAGRDRGERHTELYGSISIHSPHAGRDRHCSCI